MVFGSYDGEGSISAELAVFDGLRLVRWRRLDVRSIYPLLCMRHAATRPITCCILAVYDRWISISGRGGANSC